jgi:hypothetical protein
MGPVEKVTAKERQQRRIQAIRTLLDWNGPNSITVDEALSYLLDSDCERIDAYTAKIELDKLCGEVAKREFDKMLSREG